MEYLIIKKDDIVKRKKELRELELECLSDETAAVLRHKRYELKSLMMKYPTVDVKPLQGLVDEGYDPYDTAHHLQVQRMLKTIKEFLEKIDTSNNDRLETGS